MTAPRTGIPPVIEATTNIGLPLNETTMGQLAKQAGYATAIVGKWHLVRGGTVGGSGAQPHMHIANEPVPHVIVTTTGRVHPDAHAVHSTGVDVGSDSCLRASCRL